MKPIHDFEHKIQAIYLVLKIAWIIKQKQPDKWLPISRMLCSILPDMVMIDLSDFKGYNFFKN
jgi:hypothetical protein